MSTRKPRVLIFDDEESVLNLLSRFFSLRGYEVLSFTEPDACPIYKGCAGDCSSLAPCADIVITDFQMPCMSGVELLERQVQQGCGLDIKNKAIISGFIDGENIRRARELGCAFFNKPVPLSRLSQWVEECEGRFDLSRPVGIERKESRYSADRKVEYCYGPCEKVLDGTVINISDSGLCLKVHTPILGDETITISSGLPNCCRSAEVRWVRETENDAFMVGLNCC